jgi:hypothetical protein
VQSSYIVIVAEVKLETFENRIHEFQSELDEGRALIELVQPRFDSVQVKYHAEQQWDLFPHLNYITFHYLETKGNGNDASTNA